MNIGICMPLAKTWTDAADMIEMECSSEIRLFRGLDEGIANLDKLDAMVASFGNKEYFEKSTALKALFVPLVGVNHLPADLLMERKVAVYNCHGNAESVAERALALALAGFGRIVEFHNDLKALKWHGFWVNGGAKDNWNSIFRKRCSILGTGAIGVKLAKLLKGFDCSVSGYRRQPGKDKPEYFDRVSIKLAEALEGAEIVFIALPLTNETKGIVDAKALELVKGAYIVNVGRGAVIEEEAFYKALKEGKLRGAGIDVWYTYPQGGAETGAPSRFPFHELPNVILSPHVAGSTHEAVEINARETAENMIRWIKTGDAAHRVDLKAMY